MDEEWKSVPEYPTYSVSNFGNVKGASGKILKGRLSDGYLYINISGVGNKTIHSLVAKAFLSKPDGLNYIDHIDTNKLNNMVSNLRWCSKSQNGMNRGKQLNNTTGEKGVSFYRDRFQAGIKLNGKRIHLGYFKTLEEASMAYKNAAAQYHSTFAKF